MSDNYKIVQKSLRHKLLNISHKVKSGHIGSSLSCIDLIIAVLVFHKKNNEDFILSKGHAALALYVTLNYIKAINDKQLETFYQNGTKLAAHPSPNSFKEIPFATGSLGHGLPQATGIAYANKIKNNKLKTFVLMSDGETNEGTTWEAGHFAVSKKLSNLVVIVDNNKLQGFGKTNEVIGETCSLNKFKEIGFEIFECDGHSLDNIIKTLEKANNSNSQCPKFILAKTVKGKGVSFMENKLEWHYLPIDDNQLKLSLKDIENYTF